MNYNDPVYGIINLTAPIILDLINSKELQRLKDVQQSGFFEPHFPGTTFSRFEHSVGVSNLLKIYGASIEEQIAGLIHDVSHSAFSHTIDYVVGEGSETHQDHQDNIFSDFVRNSEIPNILKKYNFDLDFILDDKNFKLKEADLPDLCADRIDYSLRLAVRAEKLFRMGRKTVDYVREGMGVHENKWVFKDFEHAKAYADMFLTLNERYFAAIESAVMLRTMGDYLKHALGKNYITMDDIYTTDTRVLEKIKPFHKNDQELVKLYNRVILKTEFRNDPDDYDTEIYCKSRIVDPLLLKDGSVKSVSDVDPEWKDFLAEHSEPKKYFLKFND